METGREKQRYPSLNSIGVRLGTDKSSLMGDYLRHYERVFSHLRDEEFNFLEIGVFRGASVQTWSQYFSRAKIVGLDIDPHCRVYQGDRVQIEIGSQSDPEFLHNVVSRHPPLVIIDDGSHQSYDIIFTFERLFPTLLPGGIYVIEDLHFHLMNHEAERLRGGSTVLAHDYVMEIAKDRLGSEQHIRELTGLRRHLVRAIDRIEIVGQAAIFHKKPAEDIENSLRSLQQDVEASKAWLNWLVYSMKLLDAGGPLAEVADGLRRSIALNNRAVATFERLSEVLERMNDIPGAIDALGQAEAAAGNDQHLVASIKGRLERLRQIEQHR